MCLSVKRVETMRRKGKYDLIRSLKKTGTFKDRAAIKGVDFLFKKIDVRPFDKKRTLMKGLLAVEGTVATK